MVSTTTRLAPIEFDGKSETDEQTFEIVFAGLGDLRAVELDVVDGKLLLGDQLLDVVVERTDILDEVFGLLFEGKEDARLVVFDRAVVKEGHAEQGLAAARRAAQQGGPSLGEAALSHLIKATNAGWRLANGGQTACLRARLIRHRNSSPALLSTRCWNQPARNAATSTPSPANRPAGLPAMSSGPASCRIGLRGAPGARTAIHSEGDRCMK